VKFGMNLLLWTADMKEEVVPVLEVLKADGFDGVEIPIFDFDIDYSSWGRRLDDLGLERTAVTVMNEEANPISSDPLVRRQALDYLKSTIDSCAAAGVTTLVGPLYAALGTFSGQGPTDDEWKWGVETIRAAAEYASEADIVLALEALNRFEIYLLNAQADAARFAQDVDHPNARLLYDTFHANIEEKDTARGVRATGDLLAHVHISENDRSTPGSGTVNWQATFDTLHEVGYDGWLTIEAFGLALPELTAATKIWRRMYDTEEKLAADGLAFMKAEYAKRWS